VLATWPESLFAPFAMYGKGWSHWKSRQYDQAVLSFTNLIEDHPEHELIADALYGRAISRRQAGQTDEAIQDLNAYLETEPDLANRSDALYERGLAQVASGQWSEAVSTLQQLLQTNPDYAHRDKVFYEIAWAYRSMEDQTQQAEALPWFRRLTEEASDSPLAAEAWFHVGESQYDQQQYDQAAASYTAAKAAGAPGELAEKVLYKLGWSHFQQGDYEQALTAFTEQADAHASGALAADAGLMQAECLFRLEDYRRALAAYESLQGIELSSPQFSALALLHGGQSASQMKDWKKAVSFFESLLNRYDQSPYVPEARYELAFAQQNLGDEESAMQNFTLAAESSRESLGARARFMIGELHFARKDYRAAIREFQRVMFGFGGDAATDEIKPWQAKAAFEAARCSEVQIQDAAATDRPGLIADARRFYQYVVEKHPDHELAAQAKSRLQVLSKL
jgi:cellulose synthase operon protein C